MALYERPKDGSPENVSIDVHIPPDIDDQWCAWFNAEYGNAGRTVTIETHHLISMVSSMNSAGMKRYETARLARDETDGVSVKGEVVGASMVPLPIKVYGTDLIIDFDYVPHLILVNAIDPDTSEPYTNNSFERAYFPIHRTGSPITLF